MCVCAYATHMLAFDIETTGLDPRNSVVTVVCTECFFTGECVAYEFERVRNQEPQNLNLLIQNMVEAFNKASSLCAFNGVRFDIPYLHKSFNLSDSVVAQWLLKTTDILEACRLKMFGPYHTFKLDLLCEHNGVPMKTSTGLQAIAMAKEKRWDDLRTYCADDVRILCNLYRQRKLKNPRNHKEIDVALIAHDNVFAAASTGTQTSGSVHEPLQNLLAREQDKVRNLEALLGQKELQVQTLTEQLNIYHSFCTCLDES